MPSELVVWLALSVVGLAVTTHNLVNSVEDMRALKRGRVANGRRLVGKMDVGTHVLTAAKMVIMCSVGGIAAWWPAYSRFIAPLLIVLAGLIVATSVWTALMSRRLLASAQMRVSP